MNDQGKQDSQNDANGEPGPQRLSDVAADGVEPMSTDAATDAVTQAKNEAEKMKKEYLYLRAEFENFKKNAVKERSDLRKYGSERLVVDLLGVLDIFETALSPANAATTAEGVANFRKGIEMTANELKSVLNRHGVTDVASKGQSFDPMMHEALSSEETAESAPGTITQVFKKPYKLHDRVIRPGQVVVAKAKS